jgi:hypothetical protein
VVAVCLGVCKLCITLGGRGISLVLHLGLTPQIQASVTDQVLCVLPLWESNLGYPDTQAL